MLSIRQRKEKIMKKFNDNDIREALRRKENKRQPTEVPDDFLKNVLDGIEEQKPSKTVKLWHFVAAAAGLALLIGIGAAVFFSGVNNEPQQNILAVIDSVKIPQPTVEEEVVSVQEDEPPSAQEQPKKQPVKKQKPKKQAEIQQKVAEKTLQEEPEKIYPEPSKMNEVISKMAEVQHAEKQVFDCDPNDENDVKELLYVFDENEDFDLMGNLLISACNFDEKADGYFLNYSAEKFFFCLNDNKNGRTYTWIADKFYNGQILLYCTNAPLGTVSSSDCYLSYYKKTTLKNMNTYTNI